MRRLLGWAPRTRTWTDGDGTWSRPEPELDEVDLVLLAAWMRLRDDLCQCGRPLFLHEETPTTEFHTGYRTCPALAVLDEAQAAKHKSAEDEAARKDGLNPDAARTWLVWHDSEGPPRY